MSSLVLSVLVLTAILAQAQTLQRQVAAIAHRGEHLHHPENTMPAVEEAIRLHVDFVELDIRTTRDGKLVLSHDQTVDRCTNGSGKVSELTFEQLRTLDAGIKTGTRFAGTQIPAFDEALDLARKANIGIYVDVKSASAADLVSHIDGHRMTDRVVLYCSLNLARQIQTLNPKLKVMPEAGTFERAQILIEQLHPRVMAFDARDFMPDIIALVKRAGIQIFVDRLGQADHPAAWQAAIDLGADGIQTDKPQELVEFLEAKGYTVRRL